MWWQSEKRGKYTCPACGTMSSMVDGKGVASCSQCGHKRSDGLNHIDGNYFECSKCKAIFTDALRLGPRCPNVCTYTS